MQTDLWKCTWQKGHSLGQQGFAQLVPKASPHPCKPGWRQLLPSTGSAAHTQFLCLLPFPSVVWTSNAFSSCVEGILLLLPLTGS